MKKYLLPLILILFLSFVLIGDCWVAGYDQRIKLTTDHTKIDNTLSNFPITAFFTAAQAEEIFAEFDADEDFDRGQFALENDTLLKAEKELFDHSASLAIYHFKVPSVSSSAGTDIYFYYDNDADHNTSYIGIIGSATAAEVWVDFAAVYHMADATTSTVLDSTSNNNDGTKKAAGEPAEAAGKVGQGQHFDGSDDYIELADNSFESDSLGTIEAILNKDTVLKNYEMVMSSSVESAFNLMSFTSHGDVADKSYLQHYANNTARDHNDYGNSDTAFDATAHHVVLTSNGTAWEFYLDGVADGYNIDGGSNTGDWFAELPAGTHKVKLGHITWGTTNIYSLDGILDEFRYSDSVRAAAWIKATYNSLWDSLLTYGSEEISEEEEENAIFFGMDF